MARKAFVVTEAMRDRVRSLAGVGVRQEDIATIIGCDAKTLRKHCRNELDRGIAEAIAKIAGCLFAAAMRGNIVAQIFFLKTKGHWREREEPENPISGTAAESNSPVVIILPDNGRDPELTEVPRKAQKKYFARTGRQQQPRLLKGSSDFPKQRGSASQSRPITGDVGVQQDFHQSASLGDTSDISGDLSTTPPDDQVGLPPSPRNPGQPDEIRVIPSETGPAQIENAIGTRTDNGGDPLRCDQRQTISAPEE